MPLTITTRETRGVTILDLSGKLILGDESSALRDRIKQLLRDNKKKILLNLAKLSSIDSSGVGTLVFAYASAKAQHGELKLANLTQKPEEVLQVTRLVTVFDVYNSEAEGVASFQ